MNKGLCACPSSAPVQMLLKNSVRLLRGKKSLSDCYSPRAALLQGLNVELWADHGHLFSAWSTAEAVERMTESDKCVCVCAGVLWEVG